MKTSMKQLALWGSLFLLAACSSQTPGPTARTPTAPATRVSVYYNASTPPEGGP